MSSRESAAPALELGALSKSFGGVRALDGASFCVRAGSIHALLGENGAGKSTLLRVLGGALAPDAGELRLHGAARQLRSPADAFEAGVAVIHQELHLVPTLDVAENVLLGHLPRAGGIAGAFGRVDARALHERALELLAPIAPRLDTRTLVGELSPGERQLVEIAKALSRGARVLAFDEPTSSLASAETERLFALVRRLAREGCAVIWVTHRMDEVFALCDAATVMRDGRTVARHEPLAGTTREELVREMVGRDVASVPARNAPTQGTPSQGANDPNAPARELGPPVLEVEELVARGLTRPVSLHVRAGEITGLFGLVGAGRTTLLRAIYAAPAPIAGRIRVRGVARTIRSPRDALQAGLCLAPEDRRREGLVPTASVLENLNLAARRARGALVRDAWEHAHALELVRSLAIRCNDVEQPVLTLSGGNQQKVVVGRWLAMKPSVLLLDEPTRGVDVGARAELYALLAELARSGMGVLLSSSDLPEVLGICERVLVMREGALAGELSRAEATAERVLQLALPVERELAADRVSA